MLKIKDFHSDFEDCIFYEGANHYFIYESALHTAIEQIELMENGEEV